MSEIVVPENGSSSVITDISSANQGSSSGGTSKDNLKIYLTNGSPVSKDPPDFAGGPPEGSGPSNFAEQYLEVNISISRIEGHIAEVEEGEDGSWEILKEWNPGYDVNLMDLENVSVLLASLTLEPNTYTQLRLFLAKDAELLLLREETEVTELLEIPSSAQTGIKLNHPFEIIAGMITKLTIDFDANKSVVKLGNGEYLMKPVIGVSSETYSSEEVPEGAGSVSGSVSYYNSMDLVLTAIEGATIELTGGAYSFGNTTNTLADGSFGFTGVPAGNYSLNVYADGYDDYSEGIEVFADSDTIVDVVFLTEEPGGISGNVLDFDTGLPIGEATITATLSGGSTYIFVKTTESVIDGSFLLENLPVGSYELTVEADGYDSGGASGIVVGSGVTTGPVDISLSLSTP